MYKNKNYVRLIPMKKKIMMHQERVFRTLRRSSVINFVHHKWCIKSNTTDFILLTLKCICITFVPLA